MQLQFPMGGGVFRTGYDRSELLAVMDIYGIRNDKRIRILNQITYMESIAVNKLNS